MIFKKRAEEDFQVKEITSQQMKDVISRCADMYRGVPYWVSAEDNIKTINFAKAVCSETARLTTLGIKIQIGGGARGTWLQEQIDKVYFNLRHWVEYGCAYGTVIIKPNGSGFDVFTPFDFMITESDSNSNITGIIFKDSYADNDRYYTRLEYHYFDSSHPEGFRPYYIRNKAYMSHSSQSMGDPIALARTKWADLMEDSGPIMKTSGEQLDGPMFGVFRTPEANNVDMSSPLGLPMFLGAEEEMQDLDVAYSRNSEEIYDSHRIVLADDRLMYESGTPIDRLKRGVKAASVKIARFVKNVFGSGPQEFYQEINPQLNTETRITGINNFLSFIGFKCGFSNGYFVFDEKTGMVTATQVESDDRRTIQTIKDFRDKLESCLNGAIYAMNVYADLYDLAPIGNYKIVYDFGDITYNREEDRARAYQLALQGFLTKEYYLEKYEGFTSEDAAKMVAAAQPKEEPGFFQEE